MSKKIFEGNVKKVTVNEVYDLDGQIIPNNPDEFPNGRVFENVNVELKKVKHKTSYGIFEDTVAIIDGKEYKSVYSAKGDSKTNTLNITVCNGWG